MELVTAEQKDLDFIASWLQSEDEAYHADLAADLLTEHSEKGFWCNFGVIRKCFEDGELQVVRVDGNAVAFHLGEFITPGITEVHPEFRGRGIGTAIVQQVLERAQANEACILHVECISENSRRFWSRFGFIPTQESSNHLYKILTHSLPTPRQPDRTVTVEFFEEAGWYSKTPYKRVVIPCVVEDGKILLSQLCHDEIIAKPWGDRHVQVLLGDRVIFDGWLGEEATKAFGFSEDKYYSRIAKRFSPPAGTDLT